MRWLFFPLALLLLAAPLRAETITVAVASEGWSVSFSLPEAVRMREKPSDGKYYAIGAGERFSASLFVGAPHCEGSTTASAAYRCMRPRIYEVPGVVQESISLEPRKANVQVSYIQYAKMGDVAIKLMHTHVLFEKNGLWADLHVSSVKPTPAEIAALLAVGERMRIHD